VGVADNQLLLLALRPVIDALEAHGIRYYVGGSVAAAFHGVSRSTVDVDLMCELSQQQAEALIEALEDQFYVSREAAAEAIRRQSCFNLVHYSTSYKVDIFVSGQSPFDLLTIQRATRQKLLESADFEVPLLSVEDSIVRKLKWFELSGNSSERQWNDVSRLYELNLRSIDVGYLDSAAQQEGVSELLSALRSSFS
jgi:hypothetical protein